jgi:hypothetical protein
MTALRVLPFFVVGALHGQASAQPQPSFVEGPATFPGTAICGADNTIRNGVETRAGYLVDPVAETPKLGQVTYVRAVARNTNCVTDTAHIEFILPPGATLAESAQNPVRCYFHGSTVTAVPCQELAKGPTGGQWRLAPPNNIIPGKNSTTTSAHQIQVPVIFHQAIDQQMIVRTMSAWPSATGLPFVDAGVHVTVPYQPSPSPYARGNDIALLGSAHPELGTLPIAFSNDNGGFTVTNHLVGDFAEWAKLPNVKRLSGDFNGDGRTDFALIGASGWNQVPVAYSHGDGRFTVVVRSVGDFPYWATNATAKPMVGDFNRDGWSDIALIGGTGWASIPIAFGAPSGFLLTNYQVGSFVSWAATPGVRPLLADFNRDGMTDIALVGGNGWTQLPVVYSYGNGTFQWINASTSAHYWVGYHPIPYNFATAAGESGVKMVTGDFNRDGCADIALTGGASWSIRVAQSHCNGTFSYYQPEVGPWGDWARHPSAKLLAGDFNRDGYTDLALTGVWGWNTLPVASSTGYYANFNISNAFVGDFAAWSTNSSVRHVVGDFNGDGYQNEIALVGGSGWGSIPVAFGLGGGNWSIVNAGVNRFPGWASDPNATLLTGNVN